jgi:uncharacterized protein YjiS (DUF1127 family)
MIENASRQMPADAVTQQRRPAIRRFGDALRDAVDALLLWQERRRQRHELGMLSDNLLKDIGVTRLDAAAEWNKWPWQK